MAPSAGEAAVAVELERLRGTVSTGFAEVKGALSVLMERSTRNEQDLARLREDTEADIVALRAELEALKGRRWPLGAVGALSGVAGVAISLVALWLR